MGLIAAKRYVDSALTSLGAGATIAGREDLTWIMPPRPFSDRLDLELLILEQPAIDALVTLRSGLSRTRTAMADITEGRANFGLLRVTGLSNGIGHNMSVLAEVFQHIAPNRAFALDDNPPQPAISILRRLAKPPAELAG